MSCPEIEKIGQEELEDAVREHLASCAPCREKRERLARLLAFPATAEPPAFVLPRLLAKIEAPVAPKVPRPMVAQPMARTASHARRRLVAAVFACALVGSTLVAVLAGGEARAKERRLESVVVESEWRALGYTSEAAFMAESPGGVK
jgi:predicted anti-sigma-YlaC factor YlaD